MPHIHSLPDQHDITVSAWILRKINNEWKCLVHYHKKMDTLMQVGGHIELNETPWQALAHELTEESGYELDQLDILQPSEDRINGTENIVHPIPFSMNTHLVGNQHYHSDNCYGFIASDDPRVALAEGESPDLRWLSIAELEEGARNGEVLKDVAVTYSYLVDHFEQYVRLSASSFSLGKPATPGAIYMRGAAGV